MSYSTRLDEYYDKAGSKGEENPFPELKTSDRYCDFSEIAAGGMKTIFRAFDKKNQRYIAYATLNQTADLESKDLFIKEARLTAKLNHPNIIPIYNIGIDDKDCPFFTMELKSGDSLQDIINKIIEGDSAYVKKYDLRELLSIFIKVCDAVDFAHSKKVIHLDLKPENVQVGSYGEVILCDWGLSKVYDQQSDTNDLNQKLLDPELLNTNTLNGQIKGSPGFMAPEQILGEKKTPQTDIFSLGCFLYALACQKPPFRNKDLLKLIEQTALVDFSIPDNIPESIKAVINKAMAKNTDERYESVKEFKEEIEGFLNGYATEAEHASSLKLLKLFIVRNKVISYLSLVAMLVIFVGGLAFIFKIQKEKTKAEENLALYKIQKQKAEENLALYKIQEQETKKAEKEHYEASIDHLKFSFDNKYTKNTIKNLEKVISNLEDKISINPQYSEARSTLAYYLFVKQEFKRSYQILKEYPGEYEYLLPHLEKYKDLKQDDEYLNEDDFLALFNDIQPIGLLHLHMLFILRSANSNDNLVVHTVVNTLERINPRWTSKNFVYKAEDKSLIIRGVNLNKLSLDWGEKSPLTALNIEKLVLRGTSIQSILPLIDLPLSSLDISHTEVRFVNIQKFLSRSVKILYAHKNQFNKKQISQLSKSIKVKFVED